jgi:HNH endonuclease
MHPEFNLPGRGRIDGRTSSITAAFFQAITPIILPSDAEVEEVIAVLGMALGRCFCAYCGDPRTEWDHFRPIVKGRQPTGYITEIANLVPACGKCNQSKGNKNWKDWIMGGAARSPKQRGIVDLAERVARLEAYERWREPVCLDYPTMLGPERWSQYCNLLEAAVTHLTEAQRVATELRVIIECTAKVESFRRRRLAADVVLKMNKAGTRLAAPTTFD